LIDSDLGLTGNLENKRNWLVQKLESYHRTKGYDIRVVFDGWRSEARKAAERFGPCSRFD